MVRNQRKLIVLTVLHIVLKEFHVILGDVYMGCQGIMYGELSATFHE